MQVNCSINHTLNQTATDDELRLLSSLIERDFFQPTQRAVVESFVSRMIYRELSQRPHIK
ncbi:TPA: hypothetical protein ACX3IN_004903 [Vibrio parahaemolyticus]